MSFVQLFDQSLTLLVIKSLLDRNIFLMIIIETINFLDNYDTNVLR